MAVDPDVGVLIVAALALLLGVAGWHKLRRIGEFEGVLAAYRVLPAPLVAPAARLVPVLELALAAGMLVPATRAAAAAGSALLLLGYAGGIALNLLRGRRDLDCGCAGPNDRRPIAPWMVARNVLLAAAAATAAAPWSARPVDVTDFITIAGGMAVLILLYLAADRLLGQIMPRGAALRRPS
jgi:uncharacterized membrane protein